MSEISLLTLQATTSYGTNNFVLGIDGMTRFSYAVYDLISFAVTPIKLLFENKEVAHGTGFLWRTADKLFLVTNWHNSSGRNPFTGKPMTCTGVVPNAIVPHPAMRLPSGVQRGAPLTVPLYEVWHEPLWIQHPDFNEQRIDIAALEIGKSSDPYVTLQDMGWEKLHTHIGSDVSVVGYPFR